ncbi:MULTISPECIES: hypothetical protein [Bacillus]|nr:MULTISPECIES: hypothetical protein [Bacillus]
MSDIEKVDEQLLALIKEMPTLKDNKHLIETLQKGSPSILSKYQH